MKIGKWKMKNRKKGFGVLEVLVSSVIIITILGAVVMIGHVALNNSEYVGERVQASYLATEAIEQVRQIRDTNWNDQNNSTAWNSVVWNGSKNGLSIPASEDLDNATLIYHPETGVNPYNYRYGLVQTTNSPTLYETITLADSNISFKRYIELKKVGELVPPNGPDMVKDSNAIKVTAVVQWKYRGQDKEIKVSEIITNWKTQF